MGAEDGPLPKRPKGERFTPFGFACLVSCCLVPVDNDEVKVCFCCDRMEGENLFEASPELDKDLVDALNWLASRTPSEVGTLRSVCFTCPVARLLVPPG